MPKSTYSLSVTAPALTQRLRSGLYFCVGITHLRLWGGEAWNRLFTDEKSYIVGVPAFILNVQRDIEVGCANSGYGYEINLLGPYNPTRQLISEFNITPATGIVQETLSPAAGIEPSFTVPAGELWKLSNFYAILDTSAVAGNRYFELVITNSQTAFRCQNNTAIIANTITKISGQWGRGSAAASTWSTEAMMFLELPEIWLPTDSTIAVNVAGLDAGDQITEINIFGERKFYSL